MRVRFAIIAAVVVATGTAPARPSTETARAFAVRVWALNSDAAYAGMWRLMHPAQQAHLARATFVKCEQKTYGPARDDTVTATGTRASSVPVPGTRLRLA